MRPQRLHAPFLRVLKLLVASVAVLVALLLACLAIGLPHTATVQAATLVDSSSVAITKTVGVDRTNCATASSVVVPETTTVYFCLTVANVSTTTIISQVLDDGLSKVTITEPLLPGTQLVLTNASQLPVGQSLAFTKVVTTALTSPITLTATFSDSAQSTSAQIVKVATATVEIARASATIKKTVGTEPDVCASATTQSVLAGRTLYYCFTLQNTGNITLLQHTIADPTLGINAILDKPLAPSAVLTITSSDGQFGALASNFQGTADITNTVFYTGVDELTRLTAFAEAQAKVQVAKPAMAITATVGVNQSICGAHDTIGVSPGATLYYCITVKNTGNLPLTNFTVSDSLLGFNQTFTYALQPGAQILISANNPNGLAVDSSKLVVTNVQAAIDDTFTVIATPTEGQNITQSSHTQVSVGVPVIGLAKYLERDPNSCAPTASLTISSGEQVYYCLRVENRGQLTLTSYQVNELSRINLQFTYTLEPGAVLTLTNNILTSVLNASAALGPFTFNTNVVDTLTFSARNAEGITTLANASAAVNILQLTAVPTLSPTPSITPIPIATNTPTWTPSPTWTPIPSPTVPPTATPAPVVASLLAAPTATPNFLLTGVTTPVSGAQQGQSPLAVPNNPNVPQPTSPLPPPVVDNGAVAAAQTAEAAAATATGLALLTPPTPVLLETPTLSPTLTATMTPSTTLPVAAVRPLDYPSPTPVPDFLVLFAKVVDASIAAASWIWFLCGSLIFFVAAGVMAGLGFRYQHRPRYALVDNDRDSDADLYQTIATSPAPVAAPPVQPAPTTADDDYWPASLP